ncbi:CPBP family intramembrane glutamic endopeptidase [Levilactobacillus brevis]|uniref:CPBP family intramembrane glutamic endopeptidase n=1 Tax=Levilactobacillus brevis TaxID=1580 RepID=UPI003DA3000E
MTATHTVPAKRLVVQFISFWLLWFIVQIGLNQPIQRHFAGWSQEILLDLIKLIVWLGAAWWFLHQTPAQQLTVPNSQQWRVAWRFTAGYLVFGAVVVYLLFQFWLAHHGLRIAHGFIPEYWGRYFLVVGITEEFVFRGYFLNVLLKKTSLTTANVLQAIAFASLHIPRYLTTVPAMSLTSWIGNLISVFALGLLFGWLYACSHSLWPGIVTHMTWDILVTLFA